MDDVNKPLFTERELGKATINRPTQSKLDATNNVIKDEIDIQKQYSALDM